MAIAPSSPVVALVEADEFDVMANVLLATNAPVEGPFAPATPAGRSRSMFPAPKPRLLLHQNMICYSGVAQNARTEFRACLR